MPLFGDLVVALGILTNPKNMLIRANQAIRPEKLLTAFQADSYTRISGAPARAARPRETPGAD